MLKPMFPPIFDSTMLSTGRSCPQKMFRMYVEHWKPKNESIHLVAGGAFAKGLEVARKAFYEDDVHHDDAVAMGVQAMMCAYDYEEQEGDTKTLERMIGALEFYFSRYDMRTDVFSPLKTGTGRAIEFSFALPIGVDHPVTGEPILYVGRMDQIGEYQGSGVYVQDDKTTSSLGATFLQQWEMRSQFTGYCWAAREHGVKTAGALVRGVSILKTKYDTVQVMTARSDFEIERWLQQTRRDIQRFIKMWESDWWDYSLDGGCVEYGQCAFTSVCKSNSPESWLPISFEKRVWDPILRKEQSVEEWEASWGHAK